MRKNILVITGMLMVGFKIEVKAQIFNERVIINKEDVPADAKKIRELLTWRTWTEQYVLSEVSVNGVKISSIKEKASRGSSMTFLKPDHAGGSSYVLRKDNWTKNEVYKGTFAIDEDKYQLVTDFVKDGSKECQCYSIIKLGIGSLTLYREKRVKENDVETVSSTTIVLRAAY